MSPGRMVQVSIYGAPAASALPVDRIREEIAKILEMA